MTFKQKVKDIDMFGFPIQLNFDKQGSTFNTLPGGCLSLLINLILLGYSILKVDKMWFLKGDSIAFDQEPVDMESLGEVSFEEANFMPYITFKDPTKIVPENLEIDLEELGRYLHIDFLQIDYDKTREEPLETKMLEIEPCTVEHFYGQLEDFELAEAGVEGSIFCPKEMEQFKLRNNINNHTNKAMVAIQLTTCFEREDCIKGTREL